MLVGYISFLGHFWVKLCNFLCLSCESPFFLVKKGSPMPLPWGSKTLGARAKCSDARWRPYSGSQMFTGSCCADGKGINAQSWSIMHIIYIIRIIITDKSWIPRSLKKTETSHHPFLKGREHLEFAVRNFIGISAVFFLAIMHLGPGWMSHGAQWSQVPLWCHDRMPIKLINHQKMKK